MASDGTVMSAPEADPPSPDTVDDAAAAQLEAELRALFVALESRPAPQAILALIDRLDADPAPVGERRGFDGEPTE